MQGPLLRSPDLSIPEGHAPAEVKEYSTAGAKQNMRMPIKGRKFKWRAGPYRRDID